MEALSNETTHRIWRKYRRLREVDTLAGAAGPTGLAEVLFDSLVEQPHPENHLQKNSGRNNIVAALFLSFFFVENTYFRGTLGPFC